MKQLAQRMKDGELRVIEVPPPEMDEWKVLVRTAASVVSTGTERAKVEVARKSLLGKARSRPDQVRSILDKARVEGVGTAVIAVRSRLAELSPLGYCAAGVAEAVGQHVRDIRPGDLVACGGEEAAHAEILAVPMNLCVRVPEGVEPHAAAFTTLGSIALHGFRQADVALGERVAVVGMGLVGQLAARIAGAAGCEVIGVDLEEWRLQLAGEGTLSVSRTRDAISPADLDSCDAVLVTAASPHSDDPISLATDLARERGKIVVVGDVLLQLDRRRLYAKELEVRVARSYGPGRYDEEYEQRGLDYPIGYVRWTERRNMAAFLSLLAEGKVSVEDLVTHRFPIEDAAQAMDVLTRPEERALAVLIDYPATESEPTAPTSPPRRRPFHSGEAVGFIGAGSFARRTLIPLAKRHGLILDRVATASGLSAASAAEQFSFRRGASTVRELLDDDALAAVIVATRHEQHGRLALDGLRAGKAVLVEKPLCLTETDFAEIRAELENHGAVPLMVGFNRRYAPLSLALREHLADVAGPTNVLIRVNAGALPDDHWLNDPVQGGGRLLGEGCHFLDLLTYLVGRDPVGVVAQASAQSDVPLRAVQDFSVVVRFADGSLGTLLYSAIGSPRLGKELIEAHRGRRSGRIDDFRRLRLWEDGKTKKMRKHRGQDKGHSEELRSFARIVRGEMEFPGPRADLVTTALTFAALRSLGTGMEERVELPGSSPGNED